MNDKTKNSTIKKLKSYMRERYKEMYRYLCSDAPNAMDNIQFLIKNEPHFMREIEILHSEKEYEKSKNEFNKINMQITERDKYIELLENDIRLVADAINREFKRETISNRALKMKMSHIANLNDKLSELQNIYESVTAKEESRPVGRPPKNKTKELMECINNEE